MTAGRAGAVKRRQIVKTPTPSLGLGPRHPCRGTLYSSAAASPHCNFGATKPLIRGVFYFTAARHRPPRRASV